jgi:hypothetical protein
LNRFSLLLTGLMGLFFYPLLGQAQQDFVDTSTIYVDPGSKPRMTPVRKRNPKAFFRNMSLQRLVLSQQANWPLWNLSTDAEQMSQPMGLGVHLVEGLRTNQIHGFDPTDFNRPYDYFDLIYQLMELEGVNLSALEGGMSRDQLDLQPLNEVVDLIGTRTFSAQTSRHVYQIRFVRLIWLRPEQPGSAKVLAIFPYEEVASFLDQLYYRSSPDQQRALSVRKGLEFEHFQAIESPLANDPTQLMPSPTATENRPHNQAPDWWR